MSVMRMVLTRAAAVNLPPLPLGRLPHGRLRQSLLPKVASGQDLLPGLLLLLMGALLLLLLLLAVERRQARAADVPRARAEVALLFRAAPVLVAAAVAVAHPHGRPLVQEEHLIADVASARRGLLLLPLPPLRVDEVELVLTEAAVVMGLQSLRCKARGDGAAAAAAVPFRPGEVVVEVVVVVHPGSLGGGGAASAAAAHLRGRGPREGDRPRALMVLPRVLPGSEAAEEQALDRGVPPGSRPASMCDTAAMPPSRGFGCRSSRASADADEGPPSGLENRRPRDQFIVDVPSLGGGGGGGAAQRHCRFSERRKERE